LRGRSEEAIREAKRCFEEALAEDANYAEAYAGLADALFLLGSRRHMPMSEAWMKGRAALEKALSLNENLAEAHNTLANYLLSDYKFADAEREFKRALSLNQNYALAHHWYSVMLLEEGRLRQGTEEILQAEDSDPLSAVITYGAAVSLAYLGDTAGCEARIKKLRELGQADLYADSALGWLLWLKGDSEGAVKHIEQAVKSSSEGEILLSILGMFYGRLGLRDKARKVLEQFMGLPDDAYGKSFDLATVYAGLGEKDEMFRCLDRALEDRSLEFRTLRYLPFDPEIRKDPRYIELFQRVGLEP
jgi:tetratricopeptide (TPR) repeat protein